MKNFKSFMMISAIATLAACANNDSNSDGTDTSGGAVQ